METVSIAYSKALSKWVEHVKDEQAEAHADGGRIGNNKPAHRKSAVKRRAKLAAASRRRNRK